MTLSLPNIVLAGAIGLLGVGLFLTIGAALLDPALLPGFYLSSGVLLTYALLGKLHHSFYCPAWPRPEGK